MFRSSVASVRRAAVMLGLCAVAAVPMMMPSAAQAYWYRGPHGYGWHGYGWHGYGWRPGLVVGAPVVVAPVVVAPPPVVYVRPRIVVVP